MIRLALVTLLMAQPASAACHHYSVWNFNVPQHCGAKATPLPKDRSYYVEIAATPDTAIPIPALEAVETPAQPPEPDLRTLKQIGDSDEHDQAVEAHKAEINKLMGLLHAEEAEEAQAR